MRGLILATLLLPAAAAGAGPADASCGFYATRSGAQLPDTVCTVVLARDGDRTTVTIAAGAPGGMGDFALVVPVPGALAHGQIEIIDPALITRIDAHTSPRLVEYSDDARCMPDQTITDKPPGSDGDVIIAPGIGTDTEYLPGEYATAVLTVDEVGRLGAWLMERGYRIPEGASNTLRSHVDAGMSFVVTLVSRPEPSDLGLGYLRPLQFRVRSEELVLPIRPGMSNASGPRELLVFLLTRDGQVRVANHAIHEVPNNVPVPLFVREEFGAVYRALYERALSEHDGKAVFLEYAGALTRRTEPPSDAQLKALGADWIGEAGDGGATARVHVTRLHLRYDNVRVASDLIFRETGEAESFEARYIVTRPSTMGGPCPPDAGYRAELAARQREEADNLARLTGWSLTTILERMGMIR